MSTPLRSSGSLVPDSRPSRPSEDGSPRSVWPDPLPRDLDALKSEEKSNPCGGHLRVDAFLEKLPWQVRATTRITLIGPPTASLILLALDYFEYWRTVSFNFAEFFAGYFLFAIPVGYVFGTVPALLAASLYCALLTANSRRLLWRPLTRACVAALCGGLAGGVWFWVLLRSAWGIYALVGALVIAVLSLTTPQPEQVFEKGRSDRRGGSTKWSGLPAGRVTGSGTSLDLSRSRAAARVGLPEEMSGGGPRGAMRQQEAHRVC